MDELYGKDHNGDKVDIGFRSFYDLGINERTKSQVTEGKFKIEIKISLPMNCKFFVLRKKRSANQFGTRNKHNTLNAN